ncbi:MAG: SHOCT domain-containing protein [Betaproteobacteria bacterium]|nr:MAG: SHOCT domain-containing protein [Betaproteobacteria bacterium]
MWPHGPWEWFPLMWIFPLIFLVVMLLFLFRGAGWPMCGGRGMRDKEASAREILDRRYARGEVSQEEYQRMRKELE